MRAVRLKSDINTISCGVAMSVRFVNIEIIDQALSVQCQLFRPRVSLYLYSLHCTYIRDRRLRTFSGV